MNHSMSTTLLMKNTKPKHKGGRGVDGLLRSAVEESEMKYHVSRCPRCPNAYDWRPGEPPPLLQPSRLSALED